ncbi:MAG TPA: hypothetical protein VIG99_07455, partial [Myxococcaceae bacterium]
RADTRDRDVDAKTGQGTFDFRREMPRRDDHYEQLRRRYTEISKASVLELVRARRRVEYDVAYSTALAVPLTFLADLRSWVAEWRETGVMTVEGLIGKERVPKPGSRHFLTWTGASAT